MRAAELLRLEFATLSTLIGAHAAERPNAPAIQEGSRTMTYGELDARVDRVAASFQRDGSRPREAIAICAGTSIDYLATFLGALRAGIIVSPLALSSTPLQLKGMLDDSRASMLFLDAEVALHLSAVAQQISMQRVSLDGAAPGAPFEQWLFAGAQQPVPTSIRPEDPFNIIYSSGTTGTPKGIVQSHAMRWGVIHMLGAYAYAPDSVTLVSTPLYSNTTLVSIFPTLAMGGVVVLMKKFDAERFLQMASQHRVTHAMLVPIQYRRIMALATFERYDLSGFKMKFSTSAPFAADLKADVLNRWPGGLVEFYGMTEGGGACVLEAHNWPHKLGTVGRPVAGHDLRLINDDGEEVGVGEVGEVVGHSAAMMSGYYNQPLKTEEVEWFDRAGKRFIRTGDVGRFDPEGFLTLLDRKKDMIISGGFNIYPGDIEAVIAQHPDVLEAAVVGLQSNRWGETPVAFVVPKPGHEPRAAELAAFVNARVGKIQRPAAYEILDALPRSGIGKVLKRELRERKVAVE
jgi:acyl-CoA synthetase (AMP-forming)/AMP-acid ligase II